MCRCPINTFAGTEQTMTRNRNIVPFKGLNQLQDLVQRIDEVKEVPVYFTDINGDYAEIQRSKGVVNARNGHYIATVSNRYSIFQNKSLLQSITSVCEENSFEPWGKVTAEPTRFAIDCIFPEFGAITDNSPQGINMGAKLTNSYDKSWIAAGFGFLYRLICKNGMYAKSMMPELQFSQRHVGVNDGNPSKIIEGFDRFVRMIEPAKEVIGDYIHEAMDTPVKFQNLDQIAATLGAMIGSMKAGNYMVNALDNKENLSPSKYDLYNAVTAFATHSGLSMKREHDISRMGEILLQPETVIVPLTDEQLQVMIPA